MSIDPSSVIAVSAAVTVMVGALLLHSWQRSRVPALLWWAFADLLVAGGTALPLFGAPDGSLNAAANALVLVGYGAVWGGICKFDGRPTNIGLAMLGGVGWLVVSRLPFFDQDPSTQAAFGFLISGAYVTAAALVVARGRAEALSSRTAAIFLLSIHSVVLWGRVAQSLVRGWPGQELVTGSQLFAAFSLEHLLFTVATAFVLLAMMRERLEAGLKQKAYTDLLTAVPNRRAFFETGLERLAEAAKRAAPVAMVLFDLDRFKAINDQHGHEAGDQALMVFGRTAQAALRPTDVFGRIGGEEFAALLPGVSLADATTLAETVRLTFEAQLLSGPNGMFGATVSAGLAFSQASETSIDDLLRSADWALYEAKRAGRNRVQVGRPSLVRQDGREVEIEAPRPGSAVRAYRKRA